MNDISTCGQKIETPKWSTLRTPLSLPSPPTSTSSLSLLLFFDMSLEDRVALLEETVKKQSALIESQSSFIKRLASESRGSTLLHISTLDSHSRLISFFSRSLFPGGHWIEGVGKAWEWSLVSFLSHRSAASGSHLDEAHLPPPPSSSFCRRSISSRKSTDDHRFEQESSSYLPLLLARRAAPRDH